MTTSKDKYSTPDDRLKEAGDRKKLTEHGKAKEVIREVLKRAKVTKQPFMTLLPPVNPNEKTPYREGCYRSCWSL